MTETAQLRSRDAFRHEHQDTTRADVALALEVATTPAEVDAAAHLSLALFGVAGALQRFTEHDRDWPPLQQLVHEARHRVDGFPASLRASAERFNAILAASAARRHADAIAARQEREARIKRLGITNVQPTRTGTSKPKRGARP